MVKKTFTSEFKAKVAIDALKGHKTTSELASEYKVHPTQINTWKKQLLEGCKHFFSSKHEKDLDALAQERDLLYMQIGQLAFELDWLKKKTGHLK